MAKNLKLWNGRGNSLRKAGDPLWDDVRSNSSVSACVAAFSRADARRVITEYNGRDPGDAELRYYWNDTWGSGMEHITPERGLWIDVGQGPVRVV